MSGRMTDTNDAHDMDDVAGRSGWITLPVASSPRHRKRHPLKPLKLTDEILAERRAFVAPLFEYLARYSMSAIALSRRAALAAHAPFLRRNRLSAIKSGMMPAPGWLIPGVCRELGLPVEVVMGEEWAQRHLPPAPSPELPMQTQTQTIQTQPRTQKAS